MDQPTGRETPDLLLPDWIEVAAEEGRSVALGMLRERGRGAVLVGVARVDAALEALLRAALAPPRGRETLLHSDRPLGSFGARIALSARMGLIDPAVEQALNSLRRLRNGFAHSTTEVRLSDPPYCDLLRESVAQARRNPLWSPMQTILRDHLSSHGETRDFETDSGLMEFILVITILVSFLETGAHLLKPVNPALKMTFELGITPLIGSNQ